METTIAYCGLNFETFPIHPATLLPDPKMQLKLKAVIAGQRSILFGIMNVALLGVVSHEKSPRAISRMIRRRIPVLKGPCAQ